jgi:hypothetical protein
MFYLLVTVLLCHFFNTPCEFTDYTIVLGKNSYQPHNTPDLKGQYHEIFDPRFFSANNTPGSPDSWVKAVSNIM